MRRYQPSTRKTSARPRGACTQVSPARGVHASGEILRGPVNCNTGDQSNYNNVSTSSGFPASEAGKVVPAAHHTKEARGTYQFRLASPEASATLVGSSVSTMSSSRKTPAGSSSPRSSPRRPILGLAEAIRNSGRSSRRSGSTLLRAVPASSRDEPEAQQRGRSQSQPRTDSDTGSNADSSASDTNSPSSLRACYATRRSNQRRLRRNPGERSPDLAHKAPGTCAHSSCRPLIGL